MANNLTTNPWTIDTVMSSPYKAYVWIKDLTWDEQTAGGDQLVIIDQNGKPIIDTKASGANVYQRWGRIGPVNGLQVTTLTSGKVTIAI